MNTREIEYFDSILDAYNEDPNKVSEWERRFMDDTIERHEKYKEDMFMSAKQWGVIDKIAKKLGVEK